MCLLIFKPAGQTIPFDHLEQGHINNSHGSGVVAATGKKLFTLKGHDYTHEDISDYIERNTDLPMIIHFRLASHGPINYSNTHPFKLPQDWAAAHNGMIDLPIMDNTKSDTREFLERYVEPVLFTEKMALMDSHLIKNLGIAVGGYNKLVFLHKTGEASIVNESSGKWIGGIWYSNDSYKYRPPVAPGFSYPSATSCGSKKPWLGLTNGQTDIDEAWYNRMEGELASPDRLFRET